MSEMAPGRSRGDFRSRHTDEEILLCSACRFTLAFTWLGHILQHAPSAAAHASQITAVTLGGGKSAEEVEAAVGRLWNRNRPAHYGWLRQLLEQIAGGRAPAVRDLASGASGTPLLVVAGACPSVLAGMQAVVYAAMPSCVDFWWLKPSAASPAHLERETLHRHAKGAHKNTPGGSKAVRPDRRALHARRRAERPHLLGRAPRERRRRRARRSSARRAAARTTCT